MTARLMMITALCGVLVTALPGCSQPPEPLTEAEAAAAGNAMALDLYRELGTGPGNLFFSPVSISLAVAMAYTGAQGETAAEMADALGLPPEKATDLEAVSAAYGQLLGHLNPEEAAYQLRVVNRLWGQQDFEFHAAFLKRLEDRFGAGLESMDFAQDAEGSRQVINTWVAEQTEDKIQDLIPQGMLHPDTRLVLTNAIYFLGDWAHEFEKDKTVDRPFHPGGDAEITVPTMAQTKTFGHAKIDGGQLLSLPYQSGELEMVILLPDAVDGLADLEKNLTPEALTGWLEALSPALTDVQLPRFKLEGEFSLNKALQSLGMKQAFTHAADLSGMAPGGGLFISDVVHKSFVDVFEKGTEAAAATAITVRLTSMPVPVEPEAVFHADHPFLFLIRHPATGSILFMGRLTDPA